MSTARAVISRFQGSAGVRPKRMTQPVTTHLMHPQMHGNGVQSLTELLVPAGTRTEMHRHHAAEELYYVMVGRGRMQVGDDSFQVAAGDVVAVPAGLSHWVECAGSVRMRVLICSATPYSPSDTECLEVEQLPTPPGDEPNSLQADEPEDAFDEDQEPDDDLEPEPTAPPLFITSGPEAVKVRKSRNQNQRLFWKPIGLTQSGASRYETGRNIPLNVRYLLNLAYTPDREAVDTLLSHLRKPLDSARGKPALLPMFGRADGPKALALRKRLGINQAKFWASVGVTQSGGSRYENGRTMPSPVARLLSIVYAHPMHIEKRLVQLRGE